MTDAVGPLPGPIPVDRLDPHAGGALQAERRHRWVLPAAGATAVALAAGIFALTGRGGEDNASVRAGDVPAADAGDAGAATTETISDEALESIAWMPQWPETMPPMNEPLTAELSPAERVTRILDAWSNADNLIHKGWLTGSNDGGTVGENTLARREEARNAALDQLGLIMSPELAIHTVDQQIAATEIIQQQIGNEYLVYYERTLAESSDGIMPDVITAEELDGSVHLTAPVTMTIGVYNMAGEKVPVFRINSTHDFLTAPSRPIEAGEPAISYVVTTVNTNQAATADARGYFQGLNPVSEGGVEVIETGQQVSGDDDIAPLDWLPEFEKVQRHDKVVAYEEIYGDSASS